MFTSETLPSEAQLTLNGCGVRFCMTFCLFWNLEGMDTKNGETICGFPSKPILGVPLASKI